MKARSRRTGCCCAGCVVLALLAVIFAALLLIPPPRPRSLSATERAQAGRAARALRQEVETIASDARAGRPREFRLDIREEEVNEMLSSDPDIVQKLQQVELTDPYVVIEEGRVRLTATRTVSGLSVPSTVVLLPSVDANGRIVVSIEAAQAGRLKLPGGLTRRFADRLEQDLTAKVNQGPTRIRTIQVDPGRIVVEGSTR